MGYSQCWEYWEIGVYVSVVVVCLEPVSKWKLNLTKQPFPSLLIFPELL